MNRSAPGSTKTPRMSIELCSTPHWLQRITYHRPTRWQHTPRRPATGGWCRWQSSSQTAEIHTSLPEKNKNSEPSQPQHHPVNTLCVTRFQPEICFHSRSSLTFVSISNNCFAHYIFKQIFTFHWICGRRNNNNPHRTSVTIDMSMRKQMMQQIAATTSRLMLLRADFGGNMSMIPVIKPSTPTNWTQKEEDMKPQRLKKEKRGP